LKKEVMDELPDKIRQIVEVEPNPSELKEYQDVHQWWMDQYMMHYESGGFPPGFVLNMLTELRHHAGRMKISATADWVREYRDLTGKPIVVFAHHRDVIEMLSEELQEFNLGFITGEVSAEKRQVMVDQFQAGHLDVLICSTIAAKEGLTLTAADTVVFVEREWVPGWEEQAEDRVNRIGQDAETVHAIYLTVTGTIDTKFNSVIEQKREVVQAILDGGNITERSGIAKALLEEMVRAGDIPAETVRNLGLKSKD
jgi:SNF2 family DNA or RNA helicase